MLMRDKNEKMFFTDAKSAQTYSKTTVNIVNLCHHYYGWLLTCNLYCT